MGDSQRLQWLFEQVVELSAEDRVQFLREHCPSDELRKRVQNMLLVHERSEEFLKQPVEKRFRRLLDAPGERVGDFEVIRELGRGGMSTVFLARDLVLDRAVALKVLGADRGLSENTRARFLHEARAAAKLSHPNIIKIFRYGSTGPHSFIAMEYVPNGTLLAWLNHTERGKSEGRRMIVGVIAALADALNHAHREGVIHRDVKPTNVLMDEHGRPLLADFGIARVSDAELGETMAGAGTASYMSPEQITAIREGIDHRTDIFSLGVVLFEALSGRCPFEGRSAGEVMEAIRTTQPPKLRSIDRSIPRDLDIICGKALEKRTSDRYPTAGHMAADLWAWLAGDPILARPPGVGRRSADLLRSRRTVLIGLAAAVAGSSLGIYGYRWATDDRPAVRTDSLPPSADILVRAIDDTTMHPGPPRRVGRAGDGPFKFAPGHYRILADMGSDVFEYERYLLAGEQAVLLPPGQGPASDMITVPGGSGLAGAVYGDSEFARYAARVCDVEPFLIDRFEVRIAEFAKFLKQRPDIESPPHWGGREPPKEWSGDLPVTGVLYEEARAYAEWAGKRLPSAPEWELAARGTRGWLVPWCGPRDPSRMRAEGQLYLDSLIRPPPDHDTMVTGRTGLPSAWSSPAAERSHVEIIGDNVRAVTDDGGIDRVSGAFGTGGGGDDLLNMLGNVMEFTESLSRPGAHQRRRIFGNNWSMTGPATFRVPSLQNTGDRRLGTGFRCVRSIGHDWRT